MIQGELVIDKEELTTNELLKYVFDNGIINLSYVQEQVKMNKRKELLEKHPYKIWLGNDNKWYTYIPDEEKGRKLIKRSSQKLIEDYVCSYWKEEMENPTVKEVFYFWIRQKIEYNDICKGTFERYEKDFKRFFENELGFADKRIKSIKPDDIEPFIRKSITEYSLTAKSYGNLRTIIYGIFKCAKKSNYINWSISQTINDMEIPKKAFRKVVKEDDEEAFSDEENTVYEIREYPKTEAGIRTVIVPMEFIDILKKLKDLSGDKEYVFQNNGRLTKTLMIRKRLYLVCTKTEIKKKSPHKLRKTYASILLDNGLDKNMIEGLLGHTQIGTSEKYYHRNRKTDEKKSMIVSNLPEFKNTKLTF